MKVLFGAFFMCLILAYSEADLYPIRLWPGTEKKEMYAGDESACGKSGRKNDNKLKSVSFDQNVQYSGEALHHYESSEEKHPQKVSGFNSQEGNMFYNSDIEKREPFDSVSNENAIDENSTESSTQENDDSTDNASKTPLLSELTTSEMTINLNETYVEESVSENSITEIHNVETCKYDSDSSAETKIDENQFCQGKANGLYTHDSLHCQDFFNCDNETSHVQTCPSSTYFDSITRECNYTWAVECGVRPTVVHQILMVGSCLDTFNGSYVTGTIRNKQNCSEYLICDGGKSAKRVCPNKSIYNMNLSIPSVCIENDGSDPACPQTISSASREPVFEPVKLFD